MNGKNAFRHGGNLFQAMRQTGQGVSDILDFSANINPLGLSEAVLKALEDSLKYIIHYPDAEAHELKKAVSVRYEVDPELITMGNGAVEPIYILCHMLKPKRVMVTAPTFSEYERAARASGADIVYSYLHPENGFTPDLAAMAQNLAGVDIVFICNPNNPTGRLVTNSELQGLLKDARKANTLVVVDESFMDFLPDDTAYTCRKLMKEHKNLIIIHSLTKFYAIPGLRLGFALARPEITELLHQGKDPWNVNTLAQAAGVVALQDEAYRTASRAFIAESKADLYKKLRSLDAFVVYEPSVNYMLVNISKSKLCAGELRQLMAGQGILIRDCSNYPGLSADYIRLAVKKPEQHDTLLMTLKQFVGESK